MKENKINITTIGGWTGSYSVLSGIKHHEDYNISAIISMSDSWRSTGQLMDEFGVLPPWDIRRWILGLSHKSDILRELFSYRFEKWKSFKWHTVWNLLITAMVDICWDFEKWIDELGKMFDVRWKVIPVTTDKNDIWVIYEDGTEIFWEWNMDDPSSDPKLQALFGKDEWEIDGHGRINKIYMKPEATITSSAKQAIENSDIIIIWPWDLYSSIMANLLVKWTKEALKATDAKIIYICNAMTNLETPWYVLEDFIIDIEKYIWKGILDYVVINNKYISDELIEKYAQKWQKPVKLKNPDLHKGKGYKIVETDLVNEWNFIRHDPKKMARVIDDLVQGWIK